MSICRSSKQPQSPPPQRGLREKHAQSQASDSGKSSKIVVPRLDDIYPQDVRWPEGDQAIEDMESDVDPDDLNFMSDIDGEGDAMDVDKDDDSEDDDPKDDDPEDDDPQDGDNTQEHGDTQDSGDTQERGDTQDGGDTQDRGDTQDDQSGQAIGNLDPDAMPVDPTPSQSEVPIDFPLTQPPPPPALSSVEERDAHAVLVQAAAQGWDEDADMAEEDVFGTMDQADAIREAAQHLAPPSRASLLKAIASYPELIEGRLDVLHFRPPPVSEADFEAYRAKLKARIAPLPEDAPPKRKVQEVLRLVASMIPSSAPVAEPTQPVAPDARKCRSF